MRCLLLTRRPATSRHPVRAALMALCIAGFAAAASPTAQAADGNHEALFARVEAAASRGDSPALKYHLGMLLNNGIGTARDLPRAYILFKEAAAAGDMLAAYKVGCYLGGQFPGVVPLDKTEALDYKQRAAEAGYDRAQHDVGLMLLDRGDRPGAEHWLGLASHQGHLPSTALLAGWAEKDGKDPVQALGLALVMQAGMSPTPVALADRIAALKSGLDAAGRQRAEALQAGWVTGQTLLSKQAHAGMQAVEPLLLAAAPTAQQR
jgi:TPR repeat protein